MNTSTQLMVNVHNALLAAAEEEGPQNVEGDKVDAKIVVNTIAT